MYHFELFSRSFCRSLKLSVQLLYNFLRSKGCTVFRSSPRFIAKYKRHLVWHNQKNNVPWKSSRDINMTSFGVQNAKRGLHLFEDATLIFLSVYIARVRPSLIFHQTPAEITAGCACLLAEVPLEQSRERLAVAGFVASHLMHGVVNRVEVMCICSACGCPYTLTFCCQLRDIIRDIILICHARHPPNDIIAT